MHFNIQKNKSACISLIFFTILIFPDEFYYFCLEGRNYDTSSSRLLKSLSFRKICNDFGKWSQEKKGRQNCLCTMIPNLYKQEIKEYINNRYISTMELQEFHLIKYQNLSQTGNKDTKMTMTKCLPTWSSQSTQG